LVVHCFYGLMAHISEFIPDSSPVAIIIRHAERDPIRDMNSPFEAMLTDNGINQSIELGKRISKLAPVRIYYSPVPRCRDTAVNICRGINETNKAAENAGDIFDLAAPYIVGGWSTIAGIIKKSGHDTFLRSWFDGEVSDELIMPLREAFFTQMQILLKQLSENTSSTINVTHDWNILILREAIFNLRHEDIGMPDFLDGIALKITDDSLDCYYHDHHRRLPIKDLLIPLNKK